MIYPLSSTAPEPPDPRTSEFYFTLGADELTLNLCFTQSAAESALVDWGDGSPLEASGDTSAKLSHTYAAAKKYVVKVKCAEGETWALGAIIDQATYSFVETNNTTNPNTTLTKAVLRQGALLNQPGGFINCAALVSVVADDVQEIQAQTFDSCIALSTVTLGSGTTALYYNVFAGCVAMTSLTCKAIVPPTCYSVTTLRGLPENCAIYVLAESVEAYQTANRWSVRAAYIQAI